MTLDKRLHAYRDDLADFKLKGRVESARFVEARSAQVKAAVTSVHRAADASSMQLTQALYGETLRVFDERDGFAFVQLVHDHYVGYIALSAIGAVTAATHRVSVPSTLIYPKPNLKTQPATAIGMHARLSVVSEDGDYVALAGGGYVFKPHTAPLAQAIANDTVSVAERFLNVPYLWGGKSFAGLDCSGLVQVAFEACGLATPRDSDMQERDLGQCVTDHTNLRRGDLVFWKGHVGFMRNATELLHANGHHMMVAIESLAVASARILAKGGGPVTSIKRV